MVPGPTRGRRTSLPTSSAHPGGVALAEVDERTALIRDPDGTWRAAGVGSVSVWRDGHQADPAALRARAYGAG